MTDDEIERLVAKRNEALKKGQLIKSELLAHGFVLEDRPEGIIWYRENG